jgi:hypothetical protein
MGLRDHFRSRSGSNAIREASPAPKQYGPLPPDAAQPVILNLSYATPSIAILSQALDSKPLFQVDYSPTLTITHIPTVTPIGSVSFGSNYAITLSQPSTSTNLTYTDTIPPPPYFRSLNGNNIYWIAHAWNKWQCTMHAEIVDGVNYPDGVEDDVLVAVILDSRWKKGRIEFRKALMKEEMDLLILSAMAEIEDRKGKMREEGTNVAVGKGGESQVQGYLKVADSAMNLVNNINASGGGGGA